MILSRGIVPLQSKSPTDKSKVFHMRDETIGNMRPPVKQIQALPLSGRYLVEDWADLLGYEPETLRKNLRDRNVRTIPFGAKIFINVEWFWEDITPCQVAEEETGKVQSSKKNQGDGESASRGGKGRSGSEKRE